MDIHAKSALIMDYETGKVLWSRNPDVSRYPASTTKIMTSLLLLEHSLPEDVIVAPADIDKVGESSMHLKPGEQVSARDMLYAMMLRSANDGCYAVAVHVAGSVDAFSQMMNERARQIGCKNTNFHNPNGLNDELHTTTARDLALIAREAMRNPTFAEVVRTPRYQIQRSINQADTRMVSRNKWLLKDPTADGIKTGYTRPAGNCYVGSATRNGYRVITVILKSDQWQKDHEQMLDWAFDNHERLTLAEREGPLTSLPVGSVSPVQTILRRTTIERVGGHRAVEPQNLPPLQAPITKGTVLGSAVVRDAEGFEQEVQLLALADVPKAAPMPVKLASSVWPRPEFLLAGGTLAAGTWMARRRIRVRRRRVGGQTPTRF
jgi:D-alanyl-D-alanine carboxypeptidase (penicillin-binding protein 5/6)